MENDTDESVVGLIVSLYKQAAQGMFVANGLGAVSLLTTVGLMINSTEPVDQFTMASLVLAIGLFASGVLAIVGGLVLIAGGILATFRKEPRRWLRIYDRVPLFIGIAMMLVSIYCFCAGLQSAAHAFFLRWFPDRQLDIWPLW